VHRLSILKVWGHHPRLPVAGELFASGTLLVMNLAWGTARDDRGRGGMKVDTNWSSPATDTTDFKLISFLPCLGRVCQTLQLAIAPRARKVDQEAGNFYKGGTRVRSKSSKV
jgi:hypothetical protein